MVKHALLVPLLAAFVVLIVGASPAQASHSVTCTVSGETSSMTPMKFVGGTGDFTFGGQLNCGLAGNGTVLMAGTYASTVCGTANIPNPDFLDSVVNLGVGGTGYAGRFQGSLTGGVALIDIVSMQSGGESGSGTGVLHMTPSTGGAGVAGTGIGGPEIDDCINKLEGTGVIHVAFN